jgi:hypothetical protein
MKSSKIISIAEDFSSTPGARYRTDGKFSGEEFFEQILKENFQKAVDNGYELIVILDGTHGYATSFLDEAFGRLLACFSLEQTNKYLKIISEEEPYLKDEIQEYLNDRASNLAMNSSRPTTANV